MSSLFFNRSFTISDKECDVIFNLGWLGKYNASNVAISGIQYLNPYGVGYGGGMPDLQYLNRYAVGLCGDTLGYNTLSPTANGFDITVPATITQPLRGNMAFLCHTY